MIGIRADVETNRTRSLRRAGWAILVLLAHQTALAQAFPEKPVRVIVTFPPGGGADIVMRAFAPSMAEQLGRQIIVDNRPGGSGIIGMEMAAKAPPDGYTLVIGITGTLAINPTAFPKLPYDPVASYAPISLTAVGPNVLVVHPSLPARNIKELVAIAKERPGSISYASSGTGGAPHLAGELLKYMAKIDIVHVPYKGAAPATVDVVGGHVPMMFAGLGAALPHIKSEKLRPLGVAGPRRSAQLPAVPAIAEYLPGFNAETWFGMLAPRGTPDPVIRRLHGAIREAGERKSVISSLATGGYEVVLSTPEEFADLIRSDVKKWAELIRSAGIKVE